jgi:hypothetical protein
VKALAASSDTSEDVLASARLKLCRDLNNWRKTQLNLYPQLQDELGVINTAEPENDRLLIPSDFNYAQCRSLGIHELAAVEYSLREGQAHDALDKVRLAIQTFNYSVKFKANNVRGQHPNTRAQQFLSSLSKDKISTADKYRRVRMALLALGLSENDNSLQPLLDSQLWCKNESIPAAQGDAKIEDPWYWMVGRPSGLTVVEEAEWQIESKANSIYSFVLRLKICTVNRVKWFRERAARDRAGEEVEILEAEFRRAHRSYARMAEVWMELSERLGDGKGKVAYGRKQSAMYDQLALDCKEAFRKVHPRLD